MTRTVYRFRLAAVCLGLVALAFVQEPGRVAADTKLDLTANPTGFLGRALHLWDGSGFFGQVQNQAYGYLWPVGPLFALLRETGVVPWAAQRVWWSVVLLVGFLGLVRLSRHLGVTSAFARVLAGLAYVLSVRMLTELTTVSAEAWPMALAPWVLLPVVIGSARGSPRRWAALSGVAFWMTGAINAVASAAVLGLPALFLLTRGNSRRTRALLGWWSLSVVLAALWWAVPLLLLGRYSPPFLDWIEAAAITTGQNDPTSVLRGASHWVPYLLDVSGPVWPAGWALVSQPALVAATGAVALLGLAGLLSRSIPERTFLVLLLCSGLVLTGLGHVSPSGVGFLGAESVRDALDGALAPLRNVHKFQPLVTLPLMLGLAHAIQLARARTPQPVPLRGPMWKAAVGFTIAALVGMAASPAVTGQLVGGRSHLEIPSYWREAADWLNSVDDGRALVVPAASFGVYFWGQTQDEPLQVLDTQEWAVRDAVPLSSAGNIRLLDEIGRYLEAGTGSKGLATALGRAGVRWLVVRNDLDFRATRATLPIFVHQALDDTPGITRAAVFGPILSSFASGERVVDGGLSRAYSAVEVYRVPKDPATVKGRIALRDAGTVTRFTGAAEAIIDLAESELVRSGVAIAAGDPVPPGSGIREVLTDTFRRAEVNFGSAQRDYSNTLTDSDPFRSDRPVHDYYPADPIGRQSEARLLGARSVTASSSGSSPFALRGRSQAAQPWAALDGDPATAWISGDFEPGVGQWWQVELHGPRSLERIKVRVLLGERVGSAPQSLRISTDTGQQDVEITATSEWQTIALAEPVTTAVLRIELLAVEGGGPGEGFGLIEVGLPDVAVDRPIRTPPSAADGGLILAARSMGRESCAAADTMIVCDRRISEPSEERSGIDRIVDVGVGGTFRVDTRLRPRPGSALDSYLAAPSNAVQVAASSQATSDPAGRAQAAADQLPRTTWIASELDASPRLDVRLPSVQPVTGVLLQTAPDAPASRPLEVSVRINGISQTLYTDPEGRIRLPRIFTDRIELTFGAVNPVRSVDSGTGASRLLPVGVTELVVLGGEDERMRRPESSLIPAPCGFGPSVVVDAAPPIPTRVTATVGGVLSGAPAQGESCDGTLVLEPGVHRIRIEPTEEWTVDRVYLIPVDNVEPDPRPGAPRIVSWSDADRMVDIPAGPGLRLLETTENFNPGWEAWLGSEQLVGYRVDGWRQAFLIPAGAQGLVQLRYAPDRTYRLGLGLGALASLLLLLLAALPSRGPQAPATVPATLGGVRVAVPLTSAAILGGPIGGTAAVAVLAGSWLVGRWRPQRTALTVARSCGIGGAALALGAQAAMPWPERAGAAMGYDILVTVGPSVALGALAVVGWRLLDGPSEG